MPEIVACPECGRKLRVPDEFLGKKVKCPQCSVTFKAEAGGGETSGGKSPEKKKTEEPREERGNLMDRAMERNRSRSRSDEEEDDRPRSRRSRDDDDEEEDRPRSRRGRDDEDDDDRPRSRRGRSRDDDEDDYDDRPRSRRGRDDYDDDDDDDDRGRGPTPKQEKAGWKNVSFALFLIIISIWMYIGTMAVYMLGSVGLPYLMSSTGSLSGGMTLFTIFYGGMQILFIAMFICNMVGHGFTLATPAKRNWSTKPLGISSFSCLAFAALCFMLWYAWILVTFGMIAANPMGFAGPGGPSAGARFMAGGMGLMVMLALAGALSYLAGSIVFMFYLSNVCLRIKRNDLAKTVITCFIAFVAFFVISFLLSCLLGVIMGGVMAGSRDPRDAVASGATMVYIMMAFNCVLGLIGLALFIWYVVILYQVRGALDYYIRRKL